MSEDVHAGMRVSDAEREAVAHDLREHFAVGRLNLDELHERLDQVYAARTRADLATVTRDLPSLTPTGPFRSSPARRRRGPHWLPYLRVNAICWSIWGMTALASGGHSADGMWPLWVTVPWGIGLLARYGGDHRPSDGFGPRPGCR